MALRSKQKKKKQNTALTFYFTFLRFEDYDVGIPKYSMHVYAEKNVDFKDGASLLEFYALTSE